MKAKVSFKGKDSWLPKDISFIVKEDTEPSYEKLQSNWNSLREWLEKEINEREYSVDLFWHEACENILDKMNELEGKDKE